MNLKVGIIGAGLSGLACAIELEKNGFDVTVFEQAHEVGGRVKTEIIDGFLLDHGFQVYLTSYEAGKYFFDYEKLHLGAFAPGACLIKDEQKSIISDPIRNPINFFSTLLNNNATLKDKILILKLKRKASKHKNIDPKLNNQTTFDYLKQFGFSQKIISNFFSPFFAGVFLENQLKTPAGYFLYLFDKFNQGLATLPRAGMQDLARQMQKKLKKAILFGHKAISITNTEITFQDFNKYNFDYVVVATDISSLPKLGFSAKDKWNSVTTSYFKTQSKTFASKFLYLNIENKKKYVNHVACLTAAQPAYGPKDWQLFSVNCIGLDLSSASDTAVVVDDLKKMFGSEEILKWEFIKSFYIKKALPSQTHFGNGGEFINGVYRCGDYLESSSIQGALTSGSKVAQHIVSLKKIISLH